MSLVGSVRRQYRRRPTFTVLAIVALAYFLAWPFVDYWLRGLQVAASDEATAIATRYRFYDWGAYGSAVERWKEGSVIYEQNEDGGYFGTFLYPPLVLLLFYPFHTYLDFREGAMLWEAGSFLLLWIGLQLVIRELGYRLRWWHRGLLAWLLLGFQPLLFGMKMGQTPAFLVGLLCLAFVALRRQERGSENASFVSGGLTAFVGFVKFAYAPVGAHLLDDVDRLVGAIAVGLVLVGASIGVFGLELHRTYVEVLAWGVDSGGGSPRSPHFWLPGYFKPLGWLPGATALRVLASLAIAGVAVLSEDRTHQVFALGLAAFPLVTPTTYTYYLVALLPAGTILLLTELDRDGRPEIVVAGLVLANAHAYGTRFVAVTLHEAVPAVRALEPWYYAVQPGIYATLLLAGLAFARAAETVSREDVSDAVAGLGARGG